MQVDFGDGEVADAGVEDLVDVLDAVEEGDEVDEGREECREELQHDALRDLALGLGDCPVSITRIQRTGADSPSSDK